MGLAGGRPGGRTIKAMNEQKIQDTVAHELLVPYCDMTVYVVLRNNTQGGVIRATVQV